MSLHEDLLAQAEFLARHEPKRPKQATLRRAISTAYYALFHLLIHEASRLYAGHRELISSIVRVYGHGEMYEVSVAFSAGDWPKAFNRVKSSFQIRQELRDVANAFVVLQQARLDADYNLARTFNRRDTIAFIDQVKLVFSEWEAIRRDDLSRIYLACFMNWKQWDKTR
jgi:hypothetical protein